MLFNHVVSNKWDMYHHLLKLVLKLDLFSPSTAGDHAFSKETCGMSEINNFDVSNLDIQVSLLWNEEDFLMQD